MPWSTRPDCLYYSRNKQMFVTLALNVSCNKWRCYLVHIAGHIIALCLFSFWEVRFYINKVIKRSSLSCTSRQIFAPQHSRSFVDGSSCVLKGVSLFKKVIVQSPHNLSGQVLCRTHPEMHKKKTLTHDLAKCFITLVQDNILLENRKPSILTAHY